MNTPDILRRHGRATAVAGAVLAVSSATLMTVVATANAAPQNGVCADTVNVRHDPDINARIVAVCDAGRKVTAAETKNGFVHLTDLGGWAAQEYVSVNGHTPATPVDRQGSSAGASDTDSTDGDDETTTAPRGSGGPARHSAPSTAAEPAPAPSSDGADDSDSSSSSSSSDDDSDHAPDSGSGDPDDSDSGSDSDSGHLMLLGS